MKLLTQYSQINSIAWDKLVSDSPVSSWFQTREAYCFFDSLSFMDAFVIAVAEDDKLHGLTVGYIQGDGGAIKQMLSRRAIIVGGPLLSYETTKDALSLMLDGIKKLLKHRCIYIESRNLNDYSCWIDSFQACGFEYVPHLNFHQDTTSVDAINGKLSRTRKRHVHVGLRDGAIIGQVTQSSELEDFYNILLELYHRKVGKPLPPREFFEKLWQLPSAKILKIVFKDHLIGGMAYVELEGRVGYEWYVCGKDEEYKNLYPSELATYAGLQCAANNGCSRFDFMGAGKPDIPYGVRDFKALFGGELVEHGRFLVVNNKPIYYLGKAAIALLNKVHKN